MMRRILIIMLILAVPRLTVEASSMTFAKSVLTRIKAFTKRTTPIANVATISSTVEHSAQQNTVRRKVNGNRWERATALNVARRKRRRRRRTTTTTFNNAQ